MTTHSITSTPSLAKEHFENLEDAMIHTPYRQEKAILECVKAGNVSLLEETYAKLPAIKYGTMSTSSNPLKQLFYGSIANTTLVTRYAIEGGLEEETAFTLSDIYIKKMENAKTLESLNALNEEMAMDFTLRVAKIHENPSCEYSESIQQTIKLIKARTHEKLTLHELANEVHLNEKYLSFLFKKETGINLSQYILDAKIKEAKHLLTYTDYSSSEISEYLAFHSQSYFIHIFKRESGVTPGEYRRSHRLLS